MLKLGGALRICARLISLFVVVAPSASAQEVTGLAGWNIFLDPGHSRNENVGIYGYSEAHKNLRVALALRNYLLEETDIDTVYISRTNDVESVSLVDRVLLANLSGAAYFHSIHSNAAAPEANHVFTLWPQHRTGAEVAPTGGRRMADATSVLLGRGMRIGSRGGIGECDFYGVSHCRLPGATDPAAGGGKGGSRNYVQSYTNMASSLSEAGFHTNPQQNQRNMNADWKRLEARSLFWAILAFHGVERPPGRIVTGFVDDVETGKPINGATVTVGSGVYTTDTYASLFSRYSSDPGRLSNGFFFFPDVDDGTSSVSVEAEGYHPFSGAVTPVDTFFTFLDVALVSSVPPTVSGTDPHQGEANHRIIDNIVVDFSRKMDRETTEQAFAMAPEVGGRFIWSQGDTRLIFVPDSLEPRTTYTVSIAPLATGAFGDPFDGDGDGEPGGAFVLTFETGFRDILPPQITSSTPRVNAVDVDVEPVLSLVYNEPVDSTSLVDGVYLEETSTGAKVDGQVVRYDRFDRTILTFFPAGPLQSATTYRLVVEGPVADRFGNEDTATKQLPFTTGREQWMWSSIDELEDGFTDHWWVPQQSGSTTGIVSLETSMQSDTSIVNRLGGSRSAMRLNVSWDPDADVWLVREYLGGGPSKAKEFEGNVDVQAFVFGDGSGTLFRFAVDDNLPLTSAANHEVSPWFAVDWYGWRLVTWNPRRDGAGVWLGDGIAEGSLRIDSIQLGYDGAGATGGVVYIDDLRYAQRVPVGVGIEEEGPAALPNRISGNYPNPFSRSTTIVFESDGSQPATLTIFDALGRAVSRPLRDREVSPGRHRVVWQTEGLPSGMYLARLEAGRQVSERALILLR